MEGRRKFGWGPSRVRPELIPIDLFSSNAPSAREFLIKARFIVSYEYRFSFQTWQLQEFRGDLEISNKMGCKK
jgi:hypothetical protein